MKLVYSVFFPSKWRFATPVVTTENCSSRCPRQKRRTKEKVMLHRKQW